MTEPRPSAAGWAVGVAFAGAVAATIAATVAATPGEPAVQPSVLAIVGVDILPMTGEGLLEDRTVLVRDGRIERVGPAASVSVPAGARRVDGRGRFLVPGLFDMHVHVREPAVENQLLLYLAAGVTTVQNMSGSEEHLELRRRVADGELLGPRFLTTGPTTAQVGIATPAEARGLVRRQAEAGYDAVKQYGVGREAPRETYRALADEARRRGIRLVGHAPRNLPFSVVLEEGHHSIDHMEEAVYTYGPVAEAFGPYLDLQFGRMPFDSAAHDAGSLPELEGLDAAVRRFAREVTDAGLSVTPTLVAFDGIVAATTDEIRERMDAPEMAYVHPARRVGWGPRFNPYRTGGWADRLELMFAVLERSHRLQMRMVRALRGEGARILAGTDAPLPLVVPGFSLHREIELLAASGLTPLEALRAATVEAAREAGLDGEVGTVEEGKTADLLLLDADPRADASNVRRVVGVAVRGRWLSGDDLDRRLEAVAAEYRPHVERAERIADLAFEGRAEEALDLYEEDPDRFEGMAALVESMVNRAGYRLLRNGEVERAIVTFRINTERFPDSWNVWDSYAESWLTAGDTARAIGLYEKALEVDSTALNPVYMLERIRDGNGSP